MIAREEALYAGRELIYSTASMQNIFTPRFQWNCLNLAGLINVTQFSDITMAEFNDGAAIELQVASFVRYLRA